MTSAERQAYDRALRRFTAVQSPLDFAMLTAPGTQEYANVRLLNVLIVALTEHRLYKAGPCQHVSVDGLGQALPEENPPMAPRFHPSTPCFVEAGAPCMEKMFVTMPPRHGKSYLISENTPGWFLARHPNRRVVFVSYEAEFAAGYGGVGRDKLGEYGDLFGVELDKSSKAQDHWLLASGGGMVTAGALGPITGKGAHLLICDDPIKNQEEALSETLREKMWDWWHATFKTRREPGAVIILIHTRWHEDDIGGRLMDQEGDSWFHIDLPALQPADEEGLEDAGNHSGARNPLRRNAGEALVPERYTREYLLKERKGHEAWFDALYQQRPTSEGAGIFKKPNFRYWWSGGSRSDRFYILGQPGGGEKYVGVDSCYHFQTIDVAHSQKTWADYTVFSTWAATPDRELLLVARYRKRIDSADHLKELRANFEDLKRAGIPVKMIGVENKTFGSTLITHLVRMRPRLALIRKLEADGDKVTRAVPAGGAVDDGEMYWPRDAEWREEWEREHIQFPNGAHDDQVDTTSYAAYLLYEGGLPIRAARKIGPDDMSPSGREQRRLEALATGRRRRPRHPELGRLS